MIVIEEEVRVLVKVERGREDVGATISVEEETAPTATATVVAEEDAGTVVAVYMSANPLDEDPTMTFCFKSERAVGYEAGNPIGVVAVVVVEILDFDEVDEVLLLVVEDELLTAAVEDTFVSRPVAFDADALMVPFANGKDVMFAFRLVAFPADADVLMVPLATDAATLVSLPFN